MLIITKENDSIKVVGQNNPTYPYSGTLIYPLNSVTVVTDQSNMAVFRSALNNDVLFTGLIDDITIDGSPVTKEDIGSKFGAISNSASTGGTGSAVDSVNGHTGAVVLTASDVNAYTKEESDGKYATKAEIPSTDNLATKEELALKADKSSLGDYLLKSEAQSTYETINGAQSKYQAKLTAGTGIEITGENVINVTLDTNIYQVVETLPDTGINPNKIYLILSAKSGETNLYTEYLYVNNKWEEIGEYKADVDLTPYLKSSDAASTYATKQELAGETSEREQAITNLTATVQGKLDTATYNSEKATFETKENAAATYQPKGSYLTSIPEEYVTDTELIAKNYATQEWVGEQGYLTEHQDISVLATKEELNGKQDTLVSGTNIKTVNGNSLLGNGDITIEGGGSSTEAYDFKGSYKCEELTYDVVKEGVILQNVTLSGMNITTNGVLITLAKFDNTSAVGFALLSEGKYYGTNKPFLAQVLFTNVGGALITKYVSTTPTVQTGQEGTNTNYIYSNSSDDVYRAVSAVSIDTVNQKLMVRGRYWGMSDNSSINLSVSAIPEASSDSNGLLSIADKTKLDSIDVASILSRITALETQMGEVSAKLDTINGEAI